jgi:hypothetical protein
VHRINVEGWRVADAAGAAGVSTRTAHKWLARRRAGGACGAQFSARIAALRTDANPTQAA